MVAVVAANWRAVRTGCRGYAQTLVEITDLEVVCVSGQTHHPIVVKTDVPADTVPGMVFEVTEDDVVAADGYEVDDYQRVQVTLVSGVQAWVYVAAAELSSRG